jgi:hypothetical protein
MVARGLVAVSFAVLSIMVAGCGKGKGAGATAGTTSKAASTAGALVKPKEKEKEKKEHDPNAPPRKPVKHADFPNTPEGAKALVSQLVAPGVDQRAITQTLQPDLEDYDELFIPDTARKLRHEYEELWEEGKGGVYIPDGRTEVKLWKTNTEELLAGKGQDQACVDSYKGMAKLMKPGVTVYCFKFQKPGEIMGSAYDGLIYVRGHWAIFAKAEKVLQHVEEEEAEEAREKAEKEAKEHAQPKK